MAPPHETEIVTIPVPLLKQLILFAEAASQAMLAEYANQSSAGCAHVAAACACRLVLDQGFNLDG
jgi:hypothetical protein